MRQIAAFRRQKTCVNRSFRCPFRSGRACEWRGISDPDLTWKELCGIQANQVADFDDNKGQLTYLVEAIFRDFRQHDAEELKKYLQRLLSADENHFLRRPKSGRPQLKKELIGE